MIWLSWRQLRSGVAVVAAVLVAAWAAWVVTRPGVDLATGHVVDEHRLLQLLDNGIALLPVAIGAFWGAPLVARELESGTHRLVWTQSTSRTRWLAVKVAVVGVLGLGLTAVGTAGVDWWSADLDAVTGNRFAAGMFGMRGVVPVAYAAFALALGVLLGAVLRRTLPAVAATMAVFLAVRIAVTLWVRPHFQAALTSTQVTRLVPELLGRGGPAERGPGSVTSAGDWVLRFHSSVRGDILTTSVTYQPADRFWTFQWVESGLFVALAALLLGAAFGWVRSRVR